MRASAKKLTMQGPVEGKWDLPTGWEWKRLGEVALPVIRATPSTVAKDTFQYIEISCIDNTKHKITTPQMVSVKDASSRARQIIQSGDILFSGTRVYLENIAQVPGVLSGAIASTAFAVLRPNKNLMSQYAFYYVTSQTTIRALTEMQRGNSPPAISDDDFFSYPIPLPSTIQDQERIVERIDSLFAELDKAEEALRHTTTLCEQYKQSVLKAAVTGELSKEWRKANPPTETGKQLLQRILKERRAAWEKAELTKMTAKGQKPANDNWKKKYKEPQAPDTSGLPELPDGWTWASVDALSLEVQYGTSEKANDDSSGVPVLRMGNIVDGALTWDKLKYLPENEDTLSLLLNDGDLLFNRTNSLELVGKTAVFREQRKATFASYLIRVVTYGIEPELLSSYINSAIGREWIVSVASQQVGQANVNGSKLKQLFVPVPPQKEQSVICNKIQHLIESKVDLLKRIQDMLRQTTALRQSILKQAFTGQLT